MADILEYLQSNLLNSDETIWYSKDLELYNKHTQYVNKKNTQNAEEFTEKLANIPKLVDLQITKIAEEFTEKPENIPELVDCEPKKEESLLSKEITLKKKSTKKTTITSTPFDIIYSLSGIFSDHSRHYVKNKIIETISQKEYIKIFGPKKSSEIMSGIVNNTWNKSLILFISFFYDKKIIYEGKEIVYNSENVNDIINLS